MFSAGHYVGLVLSTYCCFTVHAINFVKTNSMNDGVFVQFFESENLKTLLLHSEVRCLSKDLSLEKLVILWKQVINFVKFKSEMVDCKYRKQAGVSREILEKLENTEIKSNIYYLNHICETVNMLNFFFFFKLQGKKSDLVTCAQQIKDYIKKLNIGKTI